MMKSSDSGSLLCTRCNERTPLVICNWREEHKDCMTGACPVCDAGPDGKVYCGEHMPRETQFRPGQRVRLIRSGRICRVVAYRDAVPPDEPGYSVEVEDSGKPMFVRAKGLEPYEGEDPAHPKR